MTKLLKYKNYINHSKLIYLHQTKMQTKQKKSISSLHEQNTNFLNNLYIIYSRFTWALTIRQLEFCI